MILPAPAPLCTSSFWRGFVFGRVLKENDATNAGPYARQVGRIGTAVLGRPARPVTELARCRARAIFVAAFDAERILAQMRPYLPDGAAVFSLDAMRIPANRLTNSRSYLDPLNF